MTRGDADRGEGLFRGDDELISTAGRPPIDDPRQRKQDEVQADLLPPTAAFPQNRAPGGGDGLLPGVAPRRIEDRQRGNRQSNHGDDPTPERSRPRAVAQGHAAEGDPQCQLRQHQAKDRPDNPDPHSLQGGDSEDLTDRCTAQPQQRHVAPAANGACRDNDHGQGRGQNDPR